VGGQRHDLTLYQRETDPVPIVLEAGWGLRAGLDGCGISRPHRESISGRCSLWQVSIPTELSGSYRSFPLQFSVDPLHDHSL